MSSRLVTVGLPVYNGGEFLRRALDSLLAQTHQNFEVIISDNASTDGITVPIAEEYVRRDSRIHLIRQPVNQGAIANFVWVTQQARGEYFMWAAHDDTWSPNYIQALADRLDQAPQAVLSTPRTHVEKINPAGGKVEFDFASSPDGDRWTVLDAFLVDYGCVWIYGLYQTDWLRSAALVLNDYKIIGADRLWLLDLILNHSMVGSQDAIFHYTFLDGKPKDRSWRTRIRELGIEIDRMTRSAWNLHTFSERAKALRKVWWFLYKYRISRRNPVSTLVRVTKLSILVTWYSLELFVLHLIGRMKTPATG